MLSNYLQVKLNGSAQIILKLLPIQINKNKW